MYAVLWCNHNAMQMPACSNGNAHVFMRDNGGRITAKKMMFPEVSWPQYAIKMWCFLVHFGNGNFMTT